MPTAPSLSREDLFVVPLVLLTALLLAAMFLAWVFSGLLSVTSQVLLVAAVVSLCNLTAYSALLATKYRTPPKLPVAFVVISIMVIGVVSFAGGVIELSDCGLLSRIPDSEEVATYVRTQCSLVSGISRTAGGLLILAGPVVMLLTRVSRLQALNKTA